MPEDMTYTGNVYVTGASAVVCTSAGVGNIDVVFPSGSDQHDQQHDDDDHDEEQEVVVDEANERRKSKRRRPGKNRKGEGEEEEEEDGGSEGQYLHDMVNDSAAKSVSE